MSIKEISLKRGDYFEKTLVKKICTERVINNYFKNERFTSKYDKEQFLKKLSRYCEFEYDEAAHKYWVTRIRDNPQLRSDSKIHSGIYEHLCYLVLKNIVDNYSNEDRIVASFYNYINSCNFLNKHYYEATFNRKEISEKLNIEKSVVDDFFLGQRPYLELM